MRSGLPYASAPVSVLSLSNLAECRRLMASRMLFLLVVESDMSLDVLMRQSFRVVE